MPLASVVAALLLPHEAAAAPVRGSRSPPPGCAFGKAAAREFFPATPPPRAAAGRAGSDSDVVHHNLTLEIDPNTRRLTGSDLMTVRAVLDGLAALDLRLHSSLAITRLECDGNPTTWVRLDENSVRIALDHAYNADDRFDLRIDYSGVPVSQGLGSIQFSSQGGVRLIWTLSETWFAHTWRPVKEDNRDKSTAELSFIVPSGLTVASNGVRLGVDPVGGGRWRHRWKTVYPTADYLIAFAATNYTEFGATWNYDGRTMPLQFFVYPASDTPSNRAAWLKTADMLTVFSDLFGEYPFALEKYGLAQFGWSGAMEHQTMTFSRYFDAWIVAHETAHQWWGDDVTCATWGDIWLNEGFATYCEALWEEHRPGSSGLPALQAAMQQRRPSQLDGSVYVYDAGDLGRIFSHDFSYAKGAWVLHMLRRVVGDAAFFEILAQYRAAFRGSAATTADLQAIASSVAGRDLALFFYQWVYDIGAPAYRYASRPVAVGDARYLELYVAQAQPPAYPVFEMPLDVRIALPGGSLTHVIWNNAAQQHFLIPVPGAFSSVTLDPNEWILKAAPTAAVPFVEGPPRIVAAAPAPGAVVRGRDAAALRCVFHKDVWADPGSFTLTGTALGDVACSLSYDPVAQTAVLVPGRPLRPDAYVLSISDDVLDIAAARRLDGEIADLPGAPPLPSGDGLPGGVALIRFTVGPPGDLDGDGAVDQVDLEIVLSHYGASDGGDLDGDGRTDQDDLDIVLFNFGATL